MGRCVICHNQSEEISRGLGICLSCILKDDSSARSQVTASHRSSRKRFQLPEIPPKDERGLQCKQCMNMCKIREGETGYCGIRRNEGQRLVGGDALAATVSWYQDPLPTNCVADWVCPASTAAGYPVFTDTEGAEYGYHNLAVFYQACSFDCLFCQNWHFKQHSLRGSRHRAVDLADAVNERTRCICFFGGDPSCQVEHALAAARLARQERGEGILRICWETNGSVSRRFLQKMATVSLESGGCIKFDLKAWDESVHRALCGTSNKGTLANFEYLSHWISRRSDPPLLIASTLLVPGYIDADQIGKIAEFIARLDADIPYALLAFHPSFEMTDLPTTSREHADACLEAAQSAGLTRVRLGNIHLLR